MAKDTSTTDQKNSNVENVNRASGYAAWVATLSDEEREELHEKAYRDAKHLPYAFGQSGNISYSIPELSLVDPEELVRLFSESLNRARFMNSDGMISMICHTIIEELRAFRPEGEYPNMEDMNK